MKARAVVFAYHDIGVRCLKALLAADVDVPLVVSHEDDPNESVWFGSVARTAQEYGIPLITPADPKAVGVAVGIGQLRPDFLFSFYYRHLLPNALLGIPRRGAFNMHGSLLPRYRGRAPLNWAILRGEQQTGVTLHEMVERADAGAIVDQMAVPILPDDEARDVHNKLVVAAELVLVRSLPSLISGTFDRQPQNLAAGEYVGRRSPQDGRIHWSASAGEIHDLVRALAPPWPGAFAYFNGAKLYIQRTRRAGTAPANLTSGQLYRRAGQCCVRCGDGESLRILAAATERGPLCLTTLARAAPSAERLE